MKIVIMGVGTLGKFLAETFCNDRHDVVAIDTSSRTLKRLKDKLDVMAVEGNGALAATLELAGIAEADLFIAVSKNDEQNIHACQIAKHFKVSNTICRLFTEEYFDSEKGFPPSICGIDHVILPIDDCVRKIYNVLDGQHTLEKIIFSVPNALMTAFLVMDDSPLLGMRLKDFPEPEIIQSIRLSTILRKGNLLAPNGNTVIELGDEVYVSGHKDKVMAMLDWANPERKKLNRIVIAGGTLIGVKLAEMLALAGYDVRLIEEDFDKAEKILDDLKVKMMVIRGDANDRDVLEEAGVEACDAFVAVREDDENNILSCILAKQIGAGKVITLTNKEEYIALLPNMQMIDCGFSKWLVAVNSVLRNISSINRTHTNAILHRANAYVSEFEVHENSAFCNCKIDECTLPDSTVLSMVFRDDKVLSPAGDLILLAGDLVTVIITPESEKVLGALFNGKTKSIKR